MGDKKSKFSVTCSLLSQYLKQNGSLADLSLNITPKSRDHQLSKGNFGKSRAPTTMSLLPGVVPEDSNPAENSPRSMDLFPHNTSFNKEPAAEAQTLTIFYNGKVYVSDNFPADKASDLLEMASKESCNSSAAKVAQNVGFKVPLPPVVRAEADVVMASASGSGQAVEMPENNLPKPANAADMPIARRNSLHRFLEKRKDRINTTAPYQVQRNGSSAENAEKSEDGPSWLGLGPRNSKPDNSSGSSK